MKLQSFLVLQSLLCIKQIHGRPIYNMIIIQEYDPLSKFHHELVRSYHLIQEEKYAPFFTELIFGKIQHHSHFP